jgi:hypothetical protein
MIYLLLCPLIVLLLYFGCRKLKKVKLIYCILLVLTFIPVIPFFFFYVYYSSPTAKNIALLLFASVAIASLIQRGIAQKLGVLLFVILIVSFGVSHPGSYDLSKRIVIEKFQTDNYTIFLEKTAQSIGDLFQWRGKKYLMGNTLYKWLGVTDSSSNNNKCIQTLYVKDTDNHAKGISHLEKVIDYDTCHNKIISIVNHRP